ncbi:MAG: hypothetical protein IJY66_07815 [Clostridia bacterium]|nr:hypothetical protein [Clostridia bacterium]
MRRIAIFCSERSDLAGLLLHNCAGAVLFTDEDVEFSPDEFDAACLLGGNRATPWVLHAALRIKIEQMREQGKPVFAEFVASLGQIYCDNPIPSTHHRLMVSDKDFCALERGDILDDHCNERIPYYFMPAATHVILRYFDYICGHDHADMSEEQMASGAFALGMPDDHTMICAFRLCNFRRARLAPRDFWEKLLHGIVAFLTGEPMTLHFPAPLCWHRTDACVTSSADVREAVQKGLSWFSRAQILKNNGADGVKEGFSHHVRAKDGVQLRADTVRADCTGEVGGAFLMDAICTGNAGSRAIYENTANYCFDFMQVKEGKHRGMLRWTETAWEVCYQDDVARAILGTLLAENFGGGAKHFDDACVALDYLVETTGEDGLRPFRTDICDMNEARFAQLKQAGVGVPSAHYNAYYHAALLLAARAGGAARYAEVAERGLTSLMALYPDTRRETSETEEMCRLVLPLALLYERTGMREHYGWLCRVVDDLARVQHPSGGFAEWDTGYRAACARNDRGECALLANNGDPVADLLYSNNWLPLGFAYAYFATGEQRFYDKWCEIAAFMVRAQLHSDDELLDGAWTRAMDMNRLESYGVPHDVGWAPCCIESGWTVGEILMGLQFMHVAEKKWNRI